VNLLRHKSSTCTEHLTISARPISSNAAIKRQFIQSNRTQSTQYNKKILVLPTCFCCRFFVVISFHCVCASLTNFCCSHRGPCRAIPVTSPKGTETFRQNRQIFGLRKLPKTVNSLLSAPPFNINVRKNTR